MCLAQHNNESHVSLLFPRCLFAAAAGQYTGCVINPARALGPAIVFGLSTGTVLLYVAAQMAGGALAALLAGAVHNE